MSKKHEVIQPSAWDAANDRCYCACGHYEFGADCWEARAKIAFHVRNVAVIAESFAQASI